MDERFVVCTLVPDEAGELLLIRNEEWEGRYSICTRQVDPHSENMDAMALASLRDDTGLALPDARVIPLGYLATGGRSGRTGETTRYHYYGFVAETRVNFSLPVSRAAVRSAEEIATSEDVTWTTRDVVAAIYQSQEAALAVITRPGPEQTEYLVLWNENYEGFFLPTARVTAEFPPTSVARALVRAELGYIGPVVAEEVGEVPEFQFSPRWGRERAYRFHIVRVELPPRDGEVIDLHRPGGTMDRLLRAAERRRGRDEGELPAGWSWRWLTADELRDAPPGFQFSVTMPAVVLSVLAAVPRVVRPLRRSEGSVALLREDDPTGTKSWLAQWNEGWKAYALVGGHRDAAETFRECVIRETREELGIRPGEPDGFMVTAELDPRRYVAWSRSAGEYTDYELHRFEVTLSPERRAAVEEAAGELELRWLSESEIREEQASDGRRVSETVGLLVCC
jgi:ADP-ribose pyrophosphatase YjhB (NUDIX family)